jgi:hypothetical protein
MRWTPEMAEAAKLLGLDPDNERHRRLLMECVRAAAKKRGRPKGSVHWTWDRMLALGEVAENLFFDYLFAKQRRFLSDTQLAKLISQTAGKGEFQSEEAIRRHLPMALRLYAAWYEQTEGWNKTWTIK